MPNKESKVIAKTDGEESAKEDIETQANDRLLKFFEILMQIDQRQKLDGKNNRNSNSPY